VTTDAVGPLTHRRVLNIALPIVLSNATVPILGAVDTAVVGQMGLAAPIGAVGLGAVILTGLYWIFGFLRMGTTGLTSQAIGANDQREADALLTRALLIAFTAGAGIISLQLPLFAGAFLLAPASDEVESLARDYMAIRVWSAPALIALYGITGWLIAAERTRAVLVIQVVMNLPPTRCRLQAEATAHEIQDQCIHAHVLAFRQVLQFARRLLVDAPYADRCHGFNK